MACRLASPTYASAKCGAAVESSALVGLPGTFRSSSSQVQARGSVTCRVEFSSRAVRVYVLETVFVNSVLVFVTLVRSSSVAQCACVGFRASKAARQNDETCASAFFVLLKCTKKQTNVRHTVASCSCGKNSCRQKPAVCRE